MLCQLLLYRQSDFWSSVEAFQSHSVLFLMMKLLLHIGRREGADDGKL